MHAFWSSYYQTTGDYSIGPAVTIRKDDKRSKRSKDSKMAADLKLAKARLAKKTSRKTSRKTSKKTVIDTSKFGKDHCKWLAYYTLTKDYSVGPVASVRKS
jgi:hypothetical protein